MCTYGVYMYIAEDAHKLRASSTAKPSDTLDCALHSTLRTRFRPLRCPFHQPRQHTTQLANAERRESAAHVHDPRFPRVVVVVCGLCDGVASWWTLFFKGHTRARWRFMCTSWPCNSYCLLSFVIWYFASMTSMPRQTCMCMNLCCCGCYSPHLCTGRRNGRKTEIAQSQRQYSIIRSNWNTCTHVFQH